MGLIRRQDPLYGRTAHTKCGLYLVAFSLAAALHGRRRVSARRVGRVRRGLSDSLQAIHFPSVISGVVSFPGVVI